MNWTNKNKPISAVEIRKTHLFDVATSSLIDFTHQNEDEKQTSPLDEQIDVKPAIASSDEVYDSAYLSGENNCLAIATNTENLILLDLSNGKCSYGTGHTQSILCVDSPNWGDSMLASGSKDNTILFWRLKPLKTTPMEVDGEENKSNGDSSPEERIVDQIGIATGHTHSVTSIAFSHSKTLPFLVSVAHDSTLKLWDLGNLVVKQEKGEEMKNPLKITASSTVVAHSKDINSVDVSENDKLCLTASMDKTAKLWHIDRKKMGLTLAATLEGHKRGVWCGKFSKNLQLIATCSGDLTIKLFSLLDNNACIRTLQDHQFAVLSVLFIDNSSKLVSVDGGGLIKIWDVQKGICEKTAEGHDEKIWSLRALPPAMETADSSATKPKARFVTGGADGRLFIWEDKSEELKEERRRQTAKRLTDQQTLANLLHQDRLFEALVLTLDLDQPFQCLNVLKKLFEGKKEEENLHEQHLIELIKRLNSVQLSKLLDNASQWNTNTRTYATGQIVLNCVLKSVPPDQFLKLPNIQTIIAGFLPYSIRHYERLKNMRKNAAHLDYMFTEMRRLN